MLHASLHQSLHVHHTLVVVLSDSLAVAQSDNDSVVSCCQVNVLQSSRSVSGVNDGLTLCTVVYRDTSLDSCYVGSIQCQRNVVEVALKQLNGPLHQLRSVILSRSDINVQVCSACVQLLLCSLQDRLRISLGKCLIYSRCCGGKSLTDGNKFCHSFVLLLL